MNERFKCGAIDNLFRAFMSLESIDECYDFFEDLCTVAEIQEMAKRLNAAKMLSDGAKYNDVAEKTGLSSATISRVNRSLKYGADGYKKVLERINYEE